jgi:hypothetical protein
MIACQRRPTRHPCVPELPPSVSIASEAYNTRQGHAATMQSTNAPTNVHTDTIAQLSHTHTQTHTDTHRHTQTHTHSIICPSHDHDNASQRDMNPRPNAAHHGIAERGDHCIAICRFVLRLQRCNDAFSGGVISTQAVAWR